MFSAQVGKSISVNVCRWDNGTLLKKCVPSRPATRNSTSGQLSLFVPSCPVVPLVMDNPIKTVVLLDFAQFNQLVLGSVKRLFDCIMLA